MGESPAIGTGVDGGEVFQEFVDEIEDFVLDDDPPPFLILILFIGNFRNDVTKGSSEDGDLELVAIFPAGQIDENFFMFLVDAYVEVGRVIELFIVKRFELLISGKMCSIEKGIWRMAMGL